MEGGGGAEGRVSRFYISELIAQETRCKAGNSLLTVTVILVYFEPFHLSQEKNNRFPLLDILGYLKNIHKNPKFGKVRQVPTREFPTKFPGWDLSHSSKFGIFVGILY